MFYLLNKARNKLQARRASGNPFWLFLLLLVEPLYRFKEWLRLNWHAVKVTAPFILTRDASRLRSLKNIHQGKRCFIIGLGPSLNETNLSLLKDEYTFTMNTFIPNGPGTFGITPSFYTIRDPRVMAHFLPTLAADIPSETLCFFPRVWKDYVREHLPGRDDTVFYLNPNPNLVASHGRYSSRIDHYVYKGGSVVIGGCIPVSLYMGFKEIYLLGCDCTHSKGVHFDDSVLPDQREVKWHRAIKGFSVAKAHAEKRGAIIKNATVGGELEVFERVRLEDLF